MTLEMQRALERELNSAVESGDATRIQQAHCNILLGLLDCQRKTAERVKKLQWKFTLAMMALGAGGGTIASNWNVISKIIFGN